MMRLFRRGARTDQGHTAQLGSSAVAVRLAGGVVPARCTGVAFDPSGRIRRIAQHERIVLADGEAALCFHPGPYRVEVAPFAAAPELGLAISVAIDADPRVAQQRFDLYLVAEVDTELQLSALTLAVEAALQRELAQGSLELPPCTSLEEWNTFRAALNQLLYMRFGLIVDDCVPVDLGERVDYAALLRERAVAGLSCPAPRSPSPAATIPATSDAQALRRLFLELPCVMCALRRAVLAPAQSLFRQHQALLQRLDLANLQVATMPALELAAPGQRLAGAIILQRSSATLAAVAALDEAWACLARLNVADAARLPALLDDAARIVANLELALATRRATESALSCK